jgi:D-proline reductase (dithiol) PrdB
MAIHPDAARLEGWIPKYEKWREDALPMLMKGKAKEAFAGYPFYRTEGEPFARLGKSVKQARIGLVTTGGYSIEGAQEPFAPGPNLQGETPEIHEIPLDVDQEKLRIDHFGYDHRFAKEDINVNLPLDRLQELVAAGEIGSLKSETQVLMGLAPDVEPLLKETVPALVDRFVSDSVEAALLVPS